MTEPVKRWNAPRGTTISTAENGEYVLSADYARLEQECERLRQALVHAKHFISNGIDLGFIRMPDADTPDPAHDTLTIIIADLSDKP